jgi:hypothetical protein
MRAFDLEPQYAFVEALRGLDVRHIFDGKAELENWTADAPTEKSGEFETTSAGEVEITVEHFVVNPIPGFLFLIAPADS